MTTRKALKIKLAIAFINLGMRILPQGFSNKSFIDNCMHTGIIKRTDKKFENYNRNNKG